MSCVNLLLLNWRKTYSCFNVSERVGGDVAWRVLRILDYGQGWWWSGGVA